ncbi:hypothetical protein AWZ03_007724 [Drosophila navojoa]|uniref:Uncharacterized protein n=1 Tax=Drosophila navojoa TaxID=7232 RepID=A0A484BB07_DRONA|nr:hypothetical protein AWZ03_007724 [Drosophila navojoa]
MRGTRPKKLLVELPETCSTTCSAVRLQCNRRQRVDAEGATATTTTTTTTTTLDGKCQTRDELSPVVLELVASQSSRQDSQTTARRVLGPFHVLL